MQTSTQLSNSLANPLIATEEAIQLLDILAEGTTPYDTDSAYEETNDPASTLFGFLSIVLRVTSFTGYKYVYDKGPVTTIFDWNDANNLTGEGKYLVQSVVDSKLTNGDLPLEVEGWINVPKEQLDIKVKITATEAPSETNRFGKFKVNVFWTSPGPPGRSV